MSRSVSDGSLAGLTVVDLSRVLAGPYCTQMLADHGARVIKVEPPNGDNSRQWGPPQVGDISAYYAALNRNKEHICVDLGRVEGQALLRRLLATADVLVENFKPATMDAWGLAPHLLVEEFPTLVYCRITAFGGTGPMGGLPGLDAVLQAYSGIMDMNGDPEGLPIRVPMPIVDLTTAMLAFSGVLLALNERHRSGRGQLVDLSLFESALTLLHPAAANYFMGGLVPQRLGTAHPNIAPSGSFPGPDGLVYVAGGNDQQFAVLCDHLGAPEVAEDARFRTNLDRVQHRDELTGVLGALFETAQVGRDDVMVLLAKGIPISLVRSIEQVVHDPQVAALDMIQEVDGFRVIGVPIKLDRTPGSIRRGPEARGQDTVEVLRSYGFSEAEIGGLATGAVVHQAGWTLDDHGPHSG